MFGNRGILPYSSIGLGAAKTGINWSSLLSNTQKTLGIINQAIPAFYQVKPIFNNVRTMFRVVNEMNKSDSEPVNDIRQSRESNNDTYKQENIVDDYSSEGPKFFI